MLAAAGVQAQSAANVLLVLNEASPVSLEVGQYYAQKRGITPGNIIRLKIPVDDEISRQGFERGIEAPLARWFAANSGHDRILYIVLTKGVPLRISGSGGADGTVASVDSELALLYRKMAAQPVAAAGRVPNPYFLGDVPLSQAKQFSHEFQEIYLVTRLDGYTSADIRGLIDRGFAPAKEGKIVLDEKQSGQEKGNAWLRAAADALGSLGSGGRVVHDATEKVLTGTKDVLGYYSWGSNDPAIRIRHFDFGFVPGALAGMFVSSDGRTFSEPPADWKLGTWDDKSTYFASSPQSLAGDLIRDGITGVAGHVAEPFLESTIRPDILFPAYLSGFNLAESYYLAMPYLSWQTVIVGDPLCAPFRTTSLGTEQIDKGIDEETELPAYFGPRRFHTISVAAYQQARIHPDTTRLLIRAEVRVARRDLAGARRILEEATSRDSRILSAQLTLASLYEQAQEYDKAIERYRRILQLNAENPVALNNLAYALAVRKNAPQEALPMAEKAYAATKGNPNMADTVGWIHHLLGDDKKAKPYLEAAINGGAPNPEMHFHAAAIYAALGEELAAAAELEHALQADPDLAKREDVRQLQAKLQKK